MTDSLVTLYDIRPGNGTGQFLSSWNLHGVLRTVKTELTYGRNQPQSIISGNL